jgi:hypothetical protein
MRVLTGRGALGLLAFAAMVVAGSQSARAQRSMQRSYQPATPTISPYAALLQGNVGPIPNYFSLVRPRLQQQAFNRQLRASQRFQSVQIQQLSGGGAAGREQLRQTGNRAGFMQFLHYYPQPQRTRRR